MIPEFLHRRNPTPGGMILLSLTLHLAVFLTLQQLSIYRPKLREAKTYYVDLVSLPTLEPGTAAAPPAAVAAPAVAPPLPSKPAPPAKPAMALPKPAAPQSAATAAKTEPADSRAEDAKAFAQRLNRLERNAEAKHQAEALAALQRKAADRKPGSAAPTGSGQGVDYGSYIQSRLKDALAETMVYRSKTPEAAVHLYLDRNGKVIRVVMLRPSTDRLFNDSVLRTIEKAKVNFPPTPNGQPFDKLFVFSPIEAVK